MPSVRVRRGPYTPLQDPSAPNRTLYSLFRPRSADGRTQASGPEQEPVSTQAAAPASQGQPTLRRPPSKVHNHVTRFSSIGPSAGRPTIPISASSQGGSQPQQRPRSNTLPHPGNFYRPTDDDNILAIPGQNANVLVRAPSPDDQQSSVIGSFLSLPDTQRVPATGSQQQDDLHHHDDIVEHLDVIDAQVATVANLTNAANAILIPPLAFYSRKPVFTLSSPPANIDDAEKSQDHGDSLDRHVDDVLKRPSPIKRTLKGVWSFLKTPMGIITGIYGFLVVFWGAAIVIFLAKIINLHNANTQGFWVEVSSQIENGLFTVTGIGLIPFRAMDTYRIYRIWYFKRRTKKLRQKAGLPQLLDVDDLPDPYYDSNYVHVLTDEEQNELHKHQVKFRHSQTWYRPHGTETHRAFPINTALLVCLFNDGNSIFQIMLCATMWSLNRFERPAWSTGLLIPFSFLCGIMSAVFIARGGKQTKRSEEISEKLRTVLAMEGPHHSDEGTITSIPETPSKTEKEIPPSVDSHPPPPQQTNGVEEASNGAAPHVDGDSVVQERMVVPAVVVEGSRS